MTVDDVVRRVLESSWPSAADVCPTVAFISGFGAAVLYLAHRHPRRWGLVFWTAPFLGFAALNGIIALTVYPRLLAAATGSGGSVSGVALYSTALLAGGAALGGSSQLGLRRSNSPTEAGFASLGSAVLSFTDEAMKGAMAGNLLKLSVGRRLRNIPIDVLETVVTRLVKLNVTEPKRLQSIGENIAECREDDAREGLINICLDWYHPHYIRTHVRRMCMEEACRLDGTVPATPRKRAGLMRRGWGWVRALLFARAP